MYLKGINYLALRETNEIRNIKSIAVRDIRMSYKVREMN